MFTNNLLRKATYKTALNGLNNLNFKQRTYCSKRRHVGCFDVIVVGGGIVGAATARELKVRLRNLDIALVEKENVLAAHQSGHNSGVVHAGIYYKQGTEKATLCVDGMTLAYRYFKQRGIPHKKVGKLIVATDSSQLPELDRLMNNAMDNGANVKMIGPEEIKKLQPNCVGLKAIHSRDTGIVDWGLVTRKFGEEFVERGGVIYLNFEVQSIKTCAQSSMLDVTKFPIRLTSPTQALNAAFVLCCGGLHSDKLSKMTGGSGIPAIVPFRGEYLQLIPEKQHLIRTNIYPVPDPKYPFLGVHFTPRMDGSVLLGPNAILAFKREGYNFMDISLGELRESLQYKGFQKLLKNNFKLSVNEMVKSFRIKQQVKELQKFVPDLTVSDVKRGPTGVRAQALSIDGKLVEDFVFAGGDETSPRVLHVLNAPSPAATSSMAIANKLSDKVTNLLKNYFA